MSFGAFGLGEFALGEGAPETGALLVRTRPTFATFPACATRATFNAQTRAIFPTSAASVSVPLATTFVVFYSRVVTHA